MAKYIITNKAVEDLGDIWLYTLELWSEKQADKYYKTLIDHFKTISENPFIGKKYFQISPNLYGLKSNKHIVFYSILDDKQVEIIRILNQRMDIKNRLK